MIDMERRPGERHRGVDDQPAGGVSAEGIPWRAARCPRTSMRGLDVSRILTIERDRPAVAEWLDHVVAAAPGSAPIPILGSLGWVEASEEIRLASLARYVLGTLGELDPVVIAVRFAAEIEAGRRDHAIAIRQASKAISAAADWGNLARHPSHAELTRRRAEPGSLAALKFDPEVAQRWVETGSSDSGDGSAA